MLCLFKPKWCLVVAGRVWYVTPVIPDLKHVLISLSPTVFPYLLFFLWELDQQTALGGISQSLYLSRSNSSFYLPCHTCDHISPG